MRKLNSISTHSPCRHVTRTGRRCRLPIQDTRSGLCFRHSSLQKNRLDDGAADLSAAFSGLLSDFKSASQINDFLSRLLVLLVEGRISPRHAGVMAYINSLQLRTLPAIDEELNPQSTDDSAVPNIILDLPRPPREDESQAA